jgi:hypothetical protein
VAIGQKLRPAMAPLAERKLCYGHRRSTRGHHAHQRDAAPGYTHRGEHEDAVAVPCAAAATRRVRQHLRAAAPQIDPLQLAVGKKPNRAAIRRPERIAGSLGARERLRRHLVERPHPELRHALGRRDERQLPAVGRQRERHRIARRRRGDLKARRKWLGYNATEVQRSGDCQRRRDHERQRRDDPCVALAASAPSRWCGVAREPALPRYTRSDGLPRTLWT